MTLVFSDVQTGNAASELAAGPHGGGGRVGELLDRHQSKGFWVMGYR